MVAGSSKQLSQLGTSVEAVKQQRKTSVMENV